jgi:alpha-tubulin suppressor-like RCC1 family protein
VSGGYSFDVIAGGQRHSCAINTAGDAYCWGSNSDGPVGDGTNTRRLVPALVSEPF